MTATTSNGDTMYNSEIEFGYFLENKYFLFSFFFFSIEDSIFSLDTLPAIGPINLESSQTLHADETGTITLPNYSGDQSLTPVS